MAALSGGDCGIHTGHAAAHDDHIALAKRLGGVAPAQLALTPGVDGAVPQGGNGTLAGVGSQRVEAGAAQAGGNGVLQTVAGLVDERGVGELLTAQSHEVALAGGDGLLHLIGAIEAADGHHGDVDVLLDGLGQIQVAAVLVKHGAEGLGVDVILIDAGGDVDQIDMILDQLGELDAVFQRHAALDALGAGHTVLDEEVIAADLLDAVADHDREAGAVLHAAAELVGAVVEAGGDELVQQPAMAAVQVDHLEAQGLTYPGGLGPVIGHGLHHLQRHALDLHAVLTDKGGGADGILVAGDGVGVVHGADVVQLDGGHGAVGLDGLGQRHDGLHVEGGHGVGPHVQTVLMTPCVLVVDEALGDGDFREAAPGLGLIDVDALGGGVAVIHDPVGGDRGGQHTVLEGDALDGHRGEHMGIFIAAHYDTSFLIIK